jgi:SAM-dependent methyltransferase
VTEVWGQGDAYDGFMGRWSRLVAETFVDWLAIEPGSEWLDVGCGSGALSSKILARTSPARLVAADGSAPFAEVARRRLGDGAEVIVADAADLPFEDGTFDAVVSGLVLNFLADPAEAIAEHSRVSRGTVAAYVWDYTEGMEMLRLFWEEAVALDPAAKSLDEAARFRLASEDGVRRPFEAAGLRDVESRAVDIPMRFASFDDFWTPFLGGQGPAGAYAVGLSEPDRQALRDRLRERLPIADDGSIELTARAWAVRAPA